MNVLVLHGPNLNLLGERPGDEKGKTLDQLNRLLEGYAAELGVALKSLQSNHEGVLIDTLHEKRRWADAILINPGALTHTSYALRDAIAAVNKPTIEVHLTDIRRRESWRRKSVIKDVCRAQVMGKGFDSYVQALERVVGASRKGAPVAAVLTKTLGRRAEPAPSPKVAARAPEAKTPKTLGRPDGAKKPERPTETVLTRALVRRKIADRLSGKVTPGALATWARAQWLSVQRGAAAESGQRELLEDSLQSLVLSTLPASKLSDDQLVELMTQLEG